MKAKIGTRDEARVEIGQEVSRFAFGVGMLFATLIGIWGLCCLVGGLAGSGLGGLVRGFISAVTGG